MSGTGERFIGIHTIYGADGEHETPYMTRAWIGRLRLHIFHRPDADPDCHDHPWSFWTFPIWPPRGYVEEVATRKTPFPAPVEITADGLRFAAIEYERTLDVVPAYRVSFRPAEHCHRVLGAFSRQFMTDVPAIRPDRKIITIVWRGLPERRWGFLKNRDGKWCWIAWKEYAFGGGKHGPCEPGESE